MTVDGINEHTKYEGKDKPKELTIILIKMHLKLLITQMKYQDPLQPTTDFEFIGQMAQFTALNSLRTAKQKNEFR